MTTISAKVIAHSLSKTNQEIITIQARYPLIIHAELLTHRKFSRNSASNRAIPFDKLLQEVIDDPFIPLYWGKNKPGMQASEEVTETYWCEQEWLNARDAAVESAKELYDMGLHKQVVNRLLMPFQHINTIITSTSWENFFSLRLTEEAEPHMRQLAFEIGKAIDESKPVITDVHLPYITDDERYNILPISALQRISVARCARVSYNNHDQSEPNASKDLELHNKLLESKHLSPFEHTAIANQGTFANFDGWESYRYSIENRR